MLAKGQSRQNTYLAAGIVTLNIGSGVLFGIAQTLCLGQNLLERLAVADHLGHNEVGGSVKDALHLIKAVSGKALCNRS